MNSVSLFLFLAIVAAPPDAQQSTELSQALIQHFTPPAEYADRYGDYRSPLLFDDGRKVLNREDWEHRRKEILVSWHERLGLWPKIIEKPEVDQLAAERRENFMQYTVQFELAPHHPTKAYLLVPDGSGKRAAVVVVFYDAETGVGLKGENLDFAYQLAKRGFVTLSVGHGASIYYPSQNDAQLQPLSALAYSAANAYHVLATRDEVDPQRVGIVGHSYGGKWAMFASCLYDKFACAAWSDGGIVFDESRSNVNYWEPWYLGYEGPNFRQRGIPIRDNPRTGAYKQLREAGRDLHELHALMAPRPFLVSGGSEDPPERWIPLNHTIAVNRLLGYENRVAMTNRRGHSPTAESNEVIYAFFEYFLRSQKPVDAR